MFSKWYQHFLNNRTPIGNLVELKQRSVYVFPTKFGFAYIIFTILLLMLAINFESSLVYILAFWLIGIFIVSILVTWTNLIGLRISCGRAKPIFIGQEASFSIALEGKNRHYYGISLSALGQSEFMTNVAKGGRSESSLYIEGKERGYLTLPRIKIESTYPLGLIRSWSFLRLDQKTLCYPAPLINDEIARYGTHDSENDELSLNTTATIGVDDYEGLNEYESGDSMRHIYWNAYAKGQGLYVKKFSEEESRTLWIDEAFVSGDLEQKLSKMCYLVIQAEEKKIFYGFKLGRLTFEPSNGQAHLEQCLKALALY